MCKFAPLLDQRLCSLRIPPESFFHIFRWQNPRNMELQAFQPEPCRCIFTPWEFKLIVAC
jgi:hypothetical protein